ncbi:PREDICTED: nesprin-1-like isoform X2 [Poecilia mexicana]|uniref:nesprin-1-like isoform X2 n=1 Tax=Poecilia mexicana TaxID=48701 RepID=UPI00072ECC92|nr:PREDICTED: nesprin-1-like isoform X2 [Poecilia mexicana]
MASPRHYGRSSVDIANVMQKLQDEQEAVQKRTFTKWINSHLAKHKPPLEVNDLFEDIKDGVKLLALLEVLSGQRLPCEQGRQLKRIHWVSNIGTALKFLEGRKVSMKLWRLMFYPYFWKTIKALKDARRKLNCECKIKRASFSALNIFFIFY